MRLGGPGPEGFGASPRIHAGRLLAACDDVPLAIVVVDAQERITAVRPEPDEPVTVEPVEMYRYVGEGDR